MASASPIKKTSSKLDGPSSEPQKQEAKEEAVENPFGKELKALAETSLPAWAAESDQSTPRQPMKNEEAKVEAPRLKLDKGGLDPSPTG